MPNLSLDKLYKYLHTEAINLFGNPISDWNYYGIEFNDRSPSLVYYPESGHITISLSFKAEDDYLQQVFQLAHEVCHALYPSKEYPSLFQNKILVINEGISTFFSVIMLEKLCKNGDIAIYSLKQGNLNYYNALLEVESLLTIDKDAIKKLRLLQPRIDKISFADFQKAGINISPQKITKLLRPF